MPLRFDEKKEVAALNEAFKDILLARAAIMGLDDVVIEGIGFPALTPEQKKAAPDPEKDLQILNAHLKAATMHGLTWSNDIEPYLTKLPQSFLNINAYVQAWMPAISKLSHAEKIGVLDAQAQHLDAQAKDLDEFSAKIASLSDKIVADAANFSEANKAFSELEKLDQQNLEATATAIAKVKELIDQESEKITVDLNDAENLIEIAKGVMEAGEKVKTGTEGDEIAKMLAVTVGVILIGIGEGKIDDALKTIHERLANAAKESVYEMNFTALTLQLLALQTARTSLAGLSSDIKDVYQMVDGTAVWYRARAKDLQDIIAAGAPSNEIDEVSLKAYANSWVTLSKIAQNWQTREISSAINFKVALAPFDPAIAPS